MNFRSHFLGFVLICTYFFSECYNSSLILGNSATTSNSFNIVSTIYQLEKTKKASDDISQIIELLKISLQGSLQSGDTTQTGPLVNQLKQKLAAKNIKESFLSESFFLIGTYHIIIKSYNKAITYIDSCISIKVKNGEIDERYARALYNLGLAYFYLGDFKKHEEYSSKSLEIEKKINGESSTILCNIYFSLSSAYQELQEYEKALNYSSLALEIANNHPDSISHEVMAYLYESVGVCYTRLADFSKAKIYLDKAESFYKQYNLRITDNYINLMNSSALTYAALNLTIRKLFLLRLPIILLKHII